MIGMGVLALIYGDFALVWQPVPQWVPGRTALAYASGVVLVLGGFGLLARATRARAVRILFPYLIIWALLKVPALVVAPKIEAVWLGFGELAVLMAGGWVLFARLAELPDGSALAFLTREKSIWVAQKFLAVWLIPIGLSHIFYVQPTAELVPAWLPYREGWAYLTGAGHIAAGLGILFSIFPRVTAYAEAAMIGVFTLLVWVPKIVATPKARLPWTAFFVSWIIAAAAWVVAQNLVSRKPTEQMASEKSAAV
jgi:uncharacterized membrane protein